MRFTRREERLKIYENKYKILTFLTWENPLLSLSYSKKDPEYYL